MLGRLLLDMFRRAPDEAPDKAKETNILPLDEVNCLVKGRHGWFLANRLDRYLGGALLRYGEYGEIELSLLCSLVAPGDCVIEVGANIGSHTVGLARAVGPAGSVIAIEPQPAIFRILCANLALNGLSNVITHACGCGDRRKTLCFPEYSLAQPHNSGSVSLASTGNGRQVAVAPLDELAGNPRRLRLIKIDVEGMEREVLQGAAELIAGHRPLLYVENDRPENSRSLIEDIQSKNYRLWWHTAPLFNPDNFFGVEEDDYPMEASFNMLCLPNEVAGTFGDDDFWVEITDPDYHPLDRR